MDTNRILWGVVALSGIFGPIIGMVIGLIRYNRHNNEIRKKVKEERQKAQKAGGIKSLYYKHEYKRVFAKTFGLPMSIGLIIGLILMCVAFRNL